MQFTVFPNRPTITKNQKGYRKMIENKQCLPHWMIAYGTLDALCFASYMRQEKLKITRMTKKQERIRDLILDAKAYLERNAKYFPMHKAIIYSYYINKFKCEVYNFFLTENDYFLGDRFTGKDGYQEFNTINTVEYIVTR